MNSANIISLIISLSISCTGIAILFFPTTILSTFGTCLLESSREFSTLEIFQARMIGALFLQYGWTCGALVYMSKASSLRGDDDSTSRQENRGNDSDVIAKSTASRLSLSSEAIMGLILVLFGVFYSFLGSTRNSSSDTVDENEENSCESATLLALVGVGSGMFLLACTGLMISFSPRDTSRMDSRRGENASSTATIGENNIINQHDNMVPLLSSDHLESSDDGIMDNLEEGGEAIEQTCRDHESESENERTPDNITVEEGEQQQEFSRITGIRRIIKLAGPHTFYLYLGCLVLLVRLPFSLSIPHFVSTTIGALSRSEYDKATLNIGLLFGFGTIDAALDFWCVFLFGLCNQRIVRGVRVDTFAAILRQEIAFFDVNKSGDLASRLSSDCGEMGGDLTWFFRFSIESVVRITGIVTYMLIRSPKLGLCTISAMPIVASVNKMYGDWLNQNAIEVQTALAEANSVAQETLSCVRTVIGSTSEGFEHSKYQKMIERYYNLNVRQLFAQGIYYMIVSTFLINTCVQALLLYMGMLLIRHGDLTPDILLAFMLYQSGLQNEVMNLFNSFTSLIKSSGAGDKVFELLDRVTPAPGTGSTIEGNAVDTVDKRNSNIQMQAIGFTYPSRLDSRILCNFNLDIPAGKTIALVGSSGCGKSTVVNLLQRFYDPQEGRILINGKNLRNVDVITYRRQIGFVTQDPVLFSGTILSNIIYGSELSSHGVIDDNDMLEIVNAAKLANAHNFIQGFPDRYKTEVGERGLQLSGGQKQRIAIARAIISKPSLLLLDEATSALDSESERLVQEALDRLLTANEEMTTVVIAHRLQTVRNADCIVVLNEGSVAEKGSHRELMGIEDGIYSSMVNRAGTDFLQ